MSTNEARAPSLQRSHWSANEYEEASDRACSYINRCFQSRLDLTSTNKMGRFRTDLKTNLLSLLNRPHSLSVAFSLFFLPPSAVYEVSPVWDLMIPLCSGNPHRQGRMNCTWSKIIFHRIRMEVCSWKNTKCNNNNKKPSPLKT